METVTGIEQRLTIEHGATQLLAESDSIAEAAPALIATVCQTLGWDCGAWWNFDVASDTMQSVGTWGVGTPQVDEFLEHTRTILPSRQPGGLIRRTWLAGKAIWMRDVTADKSFLRGPLALKCGLHSAFAVPIKSGTLVTGVIEFFSREIHQPDIELLDCMRYVGSQIGQFCQRTEAQQQLRESEARFRSLIELSSDWYWEQDDQFRLTFMSNRVGEKTGLDPSTYLGRKRWDQPALNLTQADWDAHRAQLNRHEPFRDFKMQRTGPDGRNVWISLSGEPIFDRNGKLSGYRGVGSDITARKQSEERIQHLATHDGLTGLPNRVMFAQMLNYAIDTAKRYERSFAVLFIDLDRFKVINDTLGHQAGDQLLQAVSARLKKAVRGSDVVARLGGDEFVILLQEVRSARQVMAVARKILSAVIKPMVISGQECRVTASIGISMYPSDATDERTLMKNADIAMYLAKEAGKNNYQIYSKEIKSQSLEKMGLETGLRRALEKNELSLHYQAKQDLRTGAITGVEALLRWNNPKLGSISPAQFIPLAEETGLIVPIGKWVLKTACAQHMAWTAAGLPPVPVAVNLSPRQFTDSDLLNDIAATLRETGMSAQMLELEITEGMVMQDADRAVQLLSAIKELGVRLAIDDFGTGYSSLAQLKRFPIDTLKVDRSFIRDIPGDTEDKAITQAIIALGKTLSLTVIAEGVETEEQKAFLRHHSCDQMQGYYFSKPVPPEQFAELLRSHTAVAG